MRIDWTRTAAAKARTRTRRTARRTASAIRFLELIDGPAPGARY